MVQAKETMVQAMVGHVLQHGVADASLRPLARAAGTSDRMLIYHFGSKQALIAEILTALGKLYGETLDAQITARAATRQACLDQLAALSRSAQMRPAMRVWMQILAAAAAGEAAYRSVGDTIIGQLLDWIAAHLPVGDPDPAGAAQTILVMIEGAIVLDLAGRSDVADAALARAFAR
ncbi:TetR/AcrR family transcriptional regulator [Novosphingobium aquiterrae]|uniref:TetR/AcrR family transcriptional regulator n=1 Tax=Novosphingobium aquiterrae TaxID=624388 RepID=A0ABV6PDR5_9SPHN